MTLLTHFAASHQVTLVTMAAIVCVVTAWLAVTLITLGSEARTRKARAVWMACVLSMSGIGVWATHFVAMLGYRPDIGIAFDLGLTLLSASFAILFVGAPLALAIRFERPGQRAVLGLLAGIGVGVMHLTGMSAIQNGVVSTDRAIVALALLPGCTLSAGALACPLGRGGKVKPILLLTLSILVLHFTAIGAVTVEASNELARFANLTPAQLGIYVTGATLALFYGAGVAASTQGRLRSRDREASRVLAEQAQHLSLALGNMSNGLLMFGPDRRILLSNRQAATVLGLREEDVRPGLTWREFLDLQNECHGVTPAERAELMQRVVGWMTAGIAARHEITFPNGRTVVVRYNPLVKGGAVLTCEDMTRERTEEQRFLHMTRHDILTGLPNRSALKEHLDVVLGRHMAVSLVKCDLDHFREVNDAFGHAVADHLLILVAERLKNCIGRAGFLARTGGDEMAIVECDLSPAEETAFGARILAEMARPFPLDECHLTVTVTLGTARYEALDGVVFDHEQLMKRAAVALGAAKQERRGSIRSFHPDMMAGLAHRRAMRADLADALAQGELSVAFQPLVGFEDGRIIGFEALVRWTHPVRGPVSPADFIPLAEESGLIREIGAFVLDEACRNVRMWPQDVHVAVNVSPVQMHSPEILAQIVSALARHGLTPNRLEIELTETAIVENGERIAERIADIRALGVKVAMDDFGTGYSSLAHLRNFGLDRIKIDRSFVSAAPTDRGCLAVLKAVTQMGRDLGVLTVGEGVENEEQFEILKELGCHVAQGWFLGRPMPGEAALALFDTERRARVV